MKFSIQREEMHHAVATVQRATATRVIQPILSNILLEASDTETLRLSATDLDFSIETTIPATFTETGRTTLSAKKLAEILSKLPGNQEVLFEIDTASQMARIRCGTSVFDMRTLPADEFPEIQQLDEAEALTVDGRTFVKAIHQTAFAAAGYDANNVLGGVYFQINQDGLEMAATDGSRLARRVDAPREGESPYHTEVSAIIPARALQEFLRLCGSDIGEQPVRLAIRDGRISFRTPRFYVLSRLMDGQYPKYNQLIPRENRIVVFAERKPFIEALERTSIMANERTNIVKLMLDGGRMSLAAQTPDVGDSTDMVPVRYDGDALNIAFNYKYVIDALKVIDSEEIRMETNGPLAPTLFRPMEENGYLCLVMPVQVK